MIDSRPPNGEEILNDATIVKDSMKRATHIEMCNTFHQMCSTSYKCATHISSIIDRDLRDPG